MPDIPYAQDEGSSIGLAVGPLTEGSTVLLDIDPMEDVASAPAGPTIPTTGQLWPRGDW